VALLWRFEVYQLLAWIRQRYQGCTHTAMHWEGGFCQSLGSTYGVFYTSGVSHVGGITAEGLVVLRLKGWMDGWMDGWMVGGGLLMELGLRIERVFGLFGVFGVLLSVSQSRRSAKTVLYLSHLPELYSRPDEYTE
jgi:hypothetical protein